MESKGITFSNHADMCLWAMCNTEQNGTEHAQFTCAVYLYSTTVPLFTM